MTHRPQSLEQEEHRDEVSVSPDLAAMDRLAGALVQLLASWWQHQAAEESDETLF